MPQNFYELVWIFIIYAFIGWCTEVAYAAVNTGKFVNRGFLNGPYCPIYGCGIVVVVTVLTPIKDNLIILFIGSFFLTSFIEYITGFVLEKAFHNKWWDYSNVPFNIKGYVCLKFSIYWGLACTFVMKIVHPIIYKFITIIPFILGVVLISIIMIVFVVDICLTVATILKINKKVKIMDEISAQIHKISDEIGENIFEGVNTAKEKSEEFQESHSELIQKASDMKDGIKEKIDDVKLQAEENKIEYKEEIKTRYEQLIKEREELSTKYKEMFEKKTFGAKRLIKAFPSMKPTRSVEIFEKYKESLGKRKNDKNN